MSKEIKKSLHPTLHCTQHQSQDCDTPTLYTTPESGLWHPYTVHSNRVRIATPLHSTQCQSQDCDTPTLHCTQRQSQDCDTPTLYTAPESGLWHTHTVLIARVRIGPIKSILVSVEGLEGVPRGHSLSSRQMFLQTPLGLNHLYLSFKFWDAIV